MLTSTLIKQAVLIGLLAALYAPAYAAEKSSPTSHNLALNISDESDSMSPYTYSTKHSPLSRSNNLQSPIDPTTSSDDDDDSNKENNRAFSTSTVASATTALAYAHYHNSDSDTNHNATSDDDHWENTVVPLLTAFCDDLPSIIRSPVQIILSSPSQRNTSNRD